MHLARIIYGCEKGLANGVIRNAPGAPALWTRAGIVLGDSDRSGSVPSVVWSSNRARGFHRTHLAEWTLGLVERYEIITYAVHSDAQFQREWCEFRQNRKLKVGAALAQSLGLSTVSSNENSVENFLLDIGVVGGPRWRGGLHQITPNASFNNLCGVAQ